MAIAWDRHSGPERGDWAYNLRQSPLVGIACAFTVGMLVDRFVHVPGFVSLIFLVVCVLAWGITQRKSQGLATVYLGLGICAMGAARHHVTRQPPANDISRLLSETTLPIQLRGVIAEDPYRSPAIREHPLRTRDRDTMFLSVLRVTHWRQRSDWIDASGRVFLSIQGEVPSLHVGDEVEVFGQLSKPKPPGNPGERDSSAELAAEGIYATMFVTSPSRAFVKRNTHGPRTWRGWLAWLRGKGKDAILARMPRGTGEIAAALLLGESSALPAQEWEKYLRTGVIAVLVISGQHLLMLAVFLEFILRLFDIRIRQRCAIIAVVILFYALLTGGRPPGLRAAFVVLAASGAIVFSRRSRAINLLAFAWLCIAVLNPNDIFSTGCQMSFLAVALLCWLPYRHLFPPVQDRMDALIEESDPGWKRAFRWFGRWLATLYLVSFFLWGTLTPLAASNYHLVSPAGLLLGPPLGLLTMAALLVGFVFLVCIVICPPLATVLAWPLHAVLLMSRGAVHTVEAWPASHFYIADIPPWWLIVYYGVLLTFLTQNLTARVTRILGMTLCAWLVLGLGSVLIRPSPKELRCTFLSVGHGGCTVLETPDGRVLLYDAGAIRGPQVAKNQIAPYLWTRGIRRIDEVFLSHGDLDHFNGMVGLLDRFAVGQVTYNPTFSEKTSPAVRYTMEVLQRRGIPLRKAYLGQRFDAGEVQLEVLHPPTTGPPGVENVRSLVLLVRHHRNTILLTGDLEAEGLERFLRLPPPKVDVLMAPHHGSRRLDVKGLLAMTEPHVVVSSEGYRARQDPKEDPYHGVEFLSTSEQGAVTLTSQPDGILVQTFRTGLTLSLARAR